MAVEGIPMHIRKAAQADADFLRPLPFDLQYKEIPGEHDFYAFNEGIKRFISWWK